MPSIPIFLLWELKHSKWLFYILPAKKTFFLITPTIMILIWWFFLRMGGGFFRIFNKSATLLFKHPTTELNPNKPYKGTVTTSREQHAVKKKASTLGASRRTPEEYMYFRQHQKWPSTLIRRDGDSPTIPVGTSSSLSSLNSSSILQNHQVIISLEKKHLLILTWKTP